MRLGRHRCVQGGTADTIQKSIDAPIFLAFVESSLTHHAIRITQTEKATCRSGQIAFDETISDQPESTGAYSSSVP
jgi:hypothetical protein